MPCQGRVVPTHILTAFIFIAVYDKQIVPVKPAIAMVFLNMNTTQVFLFGQINNLYKLACVYAYDIFTLNGCCWCLFS